MPAYNEATNILLNLRETANIMHTLGTNFEILIVDDGSPDQTWLEVSRDLHTYGENVIVVRYERNEGKGNALMCGASHATGDYIVFMDADMDLHPEQLPIFFAIMQQTDAAGVIGSKLHPLSNVNYPLIRRIWSLGYFFLVRTLFGLPVKDTQTGLKVFRAKALKAALPKLCVKRFAFDIELLSVMHRMGYSIVDAPVTLRFTRRFGRIRVSDVLNIFRETLAIFYRMYIVRYYDRHTEEFEAIPYTDVEKRFGTSNHG